jgi:hypothetical protein
MYVSPTPLGNVQALGQRVIYNPSKIPKGCSKPEDVKQYPASVELKHTLKEPEKPDILSEKAFWLSGEGAGSWFHIEKSGELFRVYRYNPEGEMECSGLFYNLNDQNLDLTISYEFLHISHCGQVMIRQNGKITSLKNTSLLAKNKRYDVNSYM